MKTASVICCLLLVVASNTSFAVADVVVNIDEVADGVIATATGHVNTNGLTLVNTRVHGGGDLRSTDALLFTGGLDFTNTIMHGYAIEGPLSWGTNIDTSGGSSPIETDWFGVWGNPNSFGTAMFLSSDYTSGDPIFSSSVFSGVTFEDLELNKGTYVYTWGSGSNPDSLTVNIGTTAVPEPSSVFLLTLSVIAMLWTRRRHVRQLGRTKR